LYNFCQFGWLPFGFDDDNRAKDYAMMGETGSRYNLLFAKPNAQRNIFTFFLPVSLYTACNLMIMMIAAIIVICVADFQEFYAWPKLNKSDREREAQQLVLYQFLYI